MFNQLTNPET